MPDSYQDRMTGCVSGQDDWQCIRTGWLAVYQDRMTGSVSGTG